ncbi:MAG: hypothetical protein AAF919_09165 [Pseudomonadota bacterium]
MPTALGAVPLDAARRGNGLTNDEISTRGAPICQGDRAAMALPKAESLGPICAISAA